MVPTGARTSAGYARGARVLFLQIIIQRSDEKDNKKGESGESILAKWHRERQGLSSLKNDWRVPRRPHIVVDRDAGRKRVLTVK